MARHFKLLLYGEPNSGKSVFACRLPKPFFITTDGNYEDLIEDFGADPNAYKTVSSWSEAKEVFDSDFAGYETIVVDLVEDLFKWCEFEFCNVNKIRHVSALPWSEGYDVTRNDFINELSILFTKGKNVVLLSHATTSTGKDRRGVEHTYYKPSNRIPDKVWPILIGKMQFVLRCYCETTVDDNDKIVNNRYLSLVPKSDEYGVLRGIDENKVPDTIPLDPKKFVEIVNDRSLRANIDMSNTNDTKANKSEDKVDEKKQEASEQKQEIKEEVKETSNAEDKKAEILKKLKEKKAAKTEEKVEEPKSEEKLSTFEENPNEVFVNGEPEVKEEPKEEVKETVQEKPVSAQDRLAAIRAKLAAAKNKQSE